jgi:hypothetical protein
VYVLVAIIRKRLKLEPSLYTLLQVISVTIFEKLPLLSALSLEANILQDAESDSQLNLFSF